MDVFFFKYPAPPEIYTEGVVGSVMCIRDSAGAVSKYYTLDGGTQASISGSVAEEGNGQYSVNLTAGEMNGAIVGLLFTHASAIPVQFTIKTTGGATTSSSESSLSLSLTGLRKEVGWLWSVSSNHLTLPTTLQASAQATA